jgi:hypothetical protein
VADALRAALGVSREALGRRRTEGSWGLPIKGNINREGERIYHTPWSRSGTTEPGSAPPMVSAGSALSATPSMPAGALPCDSAGTSLARTIHEALAGADQAVEIV